MDNIHYSLSYREDLDILILRWKNEGGSKSVMDSYLQAAELALGHDARFWLVDMQGRNLPSTNDAGWVVNHFFPTLTAQLGKEIFLAYLLPPQMLEHLWQQEGRKHLYTYNTISTSVFLVESQAFDWLFSCQSPYTSPFADLGGFPDVAGSEYYYSFFSLFIKLRPNTPALSLAPPVTLFKPISRDKLLIIRILTGQNSKSSFSVFTPGGRLTIICRNSYKIFRFT